MNKHVCAWNVDEIIAKVNMKMAQNWTTENTQKAERKTKMSMDPFVKMYILRLVVFISSSPTSKILTHAKNKT